MEPDTTCLGLAYETCPIDPFSTKRFFFLHMENIVSPCLAQTGPKARVWTPNDRRHIELCSPGPQGKSTCQHFPKVRFILTSGVECFE